jgi:hypothetical protein
VLKLLEEVPNLPKEVPKFPEEVPKLSEEVPKLPEGVPKLSKEEPPAIGADSTFCCRPAFESRLTFLSRSAQLLILQSTRHRRYKTSMGKRAGRNKTNW